MDKFVVRTTRASDHNVPSTQKQTACEINSDSLSDEGSSKSTECADPKPRSSKRPKLCRTYSKDWEILFKWIKLDEDTQRPICVACKQILICQKTHLVRHSRTKKHIDNLKKALVTEKIQIDKFLPKKCTELQQKVAIAEIKLVINMISKNQSFKSMDNLAKFHSSIYPDSLIAKSVTCSRTKSKDIVQFLGRQGFLLMIEKMQSQIFSLIIDETTDISTEKCLVIVVRQFDKLKGKTKDAFFKLVQPPDGTGESISNTLLSTLEENNIPLKNFIGISTDNASSMVGRHSGVSTLLKRKLPQMFHIGCVCHSINLINSSSLKCVPIEVENLLRNIFNYFKSSKRQSDFQELQSIFEVPEHKILRLSDTRWLSFESVANRILEQWNALQHYFIREQFEEKFSKKLEKIQQIQTNLSFVNKIYLQFLVYILKFMNSMNKAFQSNSSQIIYLIPMIKDILILLFRNFIKKDHLLTTDLCSIEYKNDSFIKDVTQIYIGHEAETLLCSENFSEIEVKIIKGNCLKFYKTVCDEILSRFNINDKKLNNLKILDPSYIKSSEDINYVDIVGNFSDIISKPDAFLNELKLLEGKINQKSYEYLFENTDVEMFWYKVGNLKNNLNEYLYPNLYEFAMYVFTLPHSSACAERIFSKLTLMKNKLTNRLKVETCHSMLSALNLVDPDIEDWTPNSDLIRKYRKDVTKK